MSCSFTLFSAATLAVRQALKLNLFRNQSPVLQVAYNTAIMALKEAHSVGIVYELMETWTGEDNAGYHEERSNVLGLFKSEHHAEQAMNDLLFNGSGSYIVAREAVGYDESVGGYDEVPRGKTVLSIRPRDLF